MNDKQSALYRLVGKEFPILLKEDSQVIRDRVIIKIQNMSVLDMVAPDKIDIEAEFNDLIYPPAKRFTIPPVSYLDTKQQYWASRRAKLIKRFGNMGETKDEVLAEGLMAKINKGASFFDPVLCELIISWFGIPGGKVFNPFCGEASIGLIASAMGCEFVGIDIRKEQVDKNNEYMSQQNLVPTPKFLCGNSLDLENILFSNGQQQKFDLIFSSPPYYDLEVYSENKGDLSAKQSYDEFMNDYFAIFKKAVSRLDDNRFLVVKVGEIRDEKGKYRNFVSDNISVFTTLGLHYYNEMILLNQFGSAPMRFNMAFRRRKIVKLHQNVLVFYKGDLAYIDKVFTKAVEPIDFNERQGELW